MKKLSSIILFSLLLTVKIDAQELTWSEIIDENPKTGVELIGSDEGGYYLLKNEKWLKPTMDRYPMASQTFRIEHYDKNLKQTKDVELALQDGADNRYTFFEFIEQFDNKLYLFTSYLDRKKKTSNLLVQTIDKGTLTCNLDIKKIKEFSFDAGGWYNRGKVFSARSRDNSKFLIYNELPKDKGSNQVMGLVVLDENMDPIWEENLALKYEEALFNLEELFVDNDGNVFVLSKIFKDKVKDKVKGEANYHYRVFAFTKEGSVRSEYTVEPDGIFIPSMKMAVSEKGKLICTGFYSFENKNYAFGTYYMIIDAESGEVLSQNKKSFTSNEVSKAKESYAYIVGDVVLKEDGSAIIIGEQREGYSIERTSGNYTSTTAAYHYYDILVSGIDVQGNVTWTKKIPKKQVTSNDGGTFSSYVLIEGRDKVYLVHNDNPKNLSALNNDKVASYNKDKDSMTILSEVDAQGNIKKKNIFTYSDTQVMVRPEFSEQISEDEMVIIGQKNTGKVQRIGHIQF